MSAVLRTPNVPLARAWNTWAADRYIEMSFKPLGVRVTPVLYAASIGKCSLVGPGSDVKLGAHATDGSLVTARITHAGTVLDWRWIKGSAYDLTGHWSGVQFGEWALRFWVVLALSSEEGAHWRYDSEARTAWLTHGPRTVALKSAAAPLLVTGHESLAALTTEYETQGYWYLASRSTEAPVLALRFNLEEMPSGRFALAIADRMDLAFDRVNATATARAPEPDDPIGSSPLGAVRDIMGWNTIWDGVNHRPYITCSRNWDLKKFGGFGFWLNDTAVNALLVSLFDPDQGREGLAALLYGQTPEGNLPCLITGNDAWVDRTQSPLVSFITWQIYLRTGDRTLLEAAYPVLAGNNRWLLTRRDGNRNGLLEFGSSDVGIGLYVGTKLAAKDESFMDNSPIHDEARWNEESRTLDCEDVGLNSLACLDCEMLARIARVLGHEDRAAAHDKAADALRQKIGAGLWDDGRKIFTNRLWTGKFVRSLGPTSFFPLVCGAASPEQKKHLLKHLADPKTFGGAFVLPSTARDDPAAKDNVYWRGRIWPILNWIVWNGLRREGEEDAARELMVKSRTLFERTWERDRHAPENYNAETGEGLDQADTDPFYSWTALIPYMASSDIVEVSPWTGMTLRPAGPDGSIGPLATPLGRVSVRRKAGVVMLSRDGDDLLTVRSAAPVCHLSWAEGLLRCEVGPGDAKDWLRLAERAVKDIELASQDGEPLDVTDEGGDVQIALRPSKRSRSLVVALRRRA